MGGRGAGVNRGGGGSPKTDNSPIVMAGRIVGVSQKAVDSLGEENTRDLIELVADSVANITGDENYMQLTIDASASGNSYAHMYLFTGQMGINPRLFKKNLAELKASYESDVKSGFHPKNTGFSDIAVHEMAHRLDGIISEKNKFKTMASTSIVREAINNLKKAGMKGDSYSIQKQLSGYGAQFYKNHTGDAYVETFAEAIADYNRNGSRANVLSREIAKITKRYL